MSKQPSPAAMRAANKILDLVEGGPVPTADSIRDIIDREYAPLVEAAKDMLEAHPKYPTRIGMEGSLARSIQEQQDAAHDKVRSALSQSGGAL